MTGHSEAELVELEQRLKQLQLMLQKRKIEQWRRRVSFGDLISERADNASLYGFGKDTTCYDNVLVLGDVKVGRNCWIGPNVILDGCGGLTIGDHVTVSAGVQIYTHDTVERTITLGASPMALASTTIGSGVYLGPNTIVQMGVTIGDRAVIGCMSLVNRHIPSRARAWGIPARIVSGESSIPSDKQRGQRA